MYLSPHEVGFTQRQGHMRRQPGTVYRIRDYPWTHCGKEAKVTLKPGGELYKCVVCGASNYRQGS